MNRYVRFQRRNFLRQILLGSSVTAVGLSGCGTLLHKERINAPQSRDLDWKIVAMNGLGLVLFFVPGVIAFVVDFYTGAIYLPPTRTAYKPDEETNFSQAELSGESWEKESLPPEQLNISEIETVLSERYDQPISLESSQTRISPLQDFAEFPEQVERHRREKGFGQSVRNFFGV